MNPPEQQHHPAGISAPDGREADSLLEGLNPAQREAVTHGEGPLLVLAGAGSGKTRVITHRIAHLIQARGVPPYRIVAVTFTNKAAGEMRERVEKLLGTSDLGGGWIGTFHALCLRILRRHGPLVGLKAGFNIYDRDDQLSLVKRIIKQESEQDDDGGDESPRTYLSRISRAKNALEGPEDLRQRPSPHSELTARIYERYEEALRQANAADFDDLLLRTVLLFDEQPDVRERYAERCEQLLVDEYQDTNRPQYLLVRALSSAHGNVCVVGDEDQSIYRFRGAEIRNILEFENDHTGTTTIRLEQNYRSSGRILAAASAVVSNNVYRKGKTLWTKNPGGDRIQLFQAPDDRSEASWVARRIQELEPETPYESTAVLYRTNAQSRQLEEAFRDARIPYQVVGSVRFYERKEIKDVLAYLRLANNPADDVSFRRIVNTPSRGIGATTLQKIEQVARAMRQPLLQAAESLLDQELLASRSARCLREFLDLIADLAGRVDEDRAPKLIERVIEAVSYEAYLKKSYPGLSDDRMENVRSLIGGAVEYEEGEESPSLAGFLDRTALVSDADEVGSRPGVTLMTVHCAKGLEFPNVFLVGLEESLFPHMLASEQMEDIEEERRLCYVAMTRAQRRLLLAYACFRRLHGPLLPSRPSRFLNEIPLELIELVEDEPAGPAASWDAQRASATAWAGGSAASRYSASAAAMAARRRKRSAPTPPLPPAGEDPGDGYPVGVLVRHPRFGNGRILGREGSGKNLKLLIDFFEYGQKKILPSYTKLQVQTR